jgi:rRNA maturation endonuclease Nob1
MTNYEIFCEACGTDYEVQIEGNKKIKFCTVCGEELDDSNIAESGDGWEDDADIDENWDWGTDEK